MSEPAQNNRYVEVPLRGLIVCFKQEGNNVFFETNFNNTDGPLEVRVRAGYYSFMYTATGMLPVNPGIMIQNASNNKICIIDNVNYDDESDYTRLFNAYLDIDAIKRMYQ